MHNLGRELRIMHACELGAVGVYRGHKCVARYFFRSKISELDIMRFHERDHSNIFFNLLNLHGERTCYFSFLWFWGGLFYGVAVGLFGVKAIGISTVTIEEIVDLELEASLSKLSNYPEICKVLKEVQIDERNHKASGEIFSNGSSVGNSPIFNVAKFFAYFSKNLASILEWEKYMNEIDVEKNALQIHLGAEFEKLDQIVKEAHIGQKHLEGFILVERGNKFSNVLCNLLNMPESGNNVWNTVNSYHYSNCMKWERTFDGKPFISNFVLSGNYLIETIGAFKLYLVGSVEKGALIYRLKYVKWFGIKLPSTFAPSLFASESEENGKYKFVVVVSLPMIGLLIKYSGLIDLCSK